MPSSNIDNCARVRQTVPSVVCGQINRPRSRRFAKKTKSVAIDPYGRVRQCIPRHAVDALPAQFGFRDDITFYTAHGDVFGWLCAIFGLGIVTWAAGKTLRASIVTSAAKS